MSALHGSSPIANSSCLAGVPIPETYKRGDAPQRAAHRLEGRWQAAELSRTKVFRTSTRKPRGQLGPQLRRGICYIAKHPRHLLASRVARTDKRPDRDLMGRAMGLQNKGHLRRPPQQFQCESCG
jgi:hypothetical protein